MDCFCCDDDYAAVVVVHHPYIIMFTLGWCNWELNVGLLLLRGFSIGFPGVGKLIDLNRGWAGFGTLVKQLDCQQPGHWGTDTSVKWLVSVVVDVDWPLLHYNAHRDSDSIVWYRYNWDITIIESWLLDCFSCDDVSPPVGVVIDMYIIVTLQWSPR